MAKTASSATTVTPAVTEIPATDERTGTDIVLPNGNVVTVREVPVAEVEVFLTGGLAKDNEDPADVVRRMVGQTLAAQTDDELFGDNSPKNLRDDYLETPFVATGVTWYKSTIKAEEGKFSTGVFMVMDAVNAEGERVLISTSATMPMAKMRNYQIGDRFPTPPIMGVARERATQNGFHPLDLVYAAIK